MRQSVENGVESREYNILGVNNIDIDGDDIDAHYFLLLSTFDGIGYY